MKISVPIISLILALLANLYAYPVKTAETGYFIFEVPDTWSINMDDSFSRLAQSTVIGYTNPGGIPEYYMLIVTGELKTTPSRMISIFTENAATLFPGMKLSPLTAGKFRGFNTLEASHTIGSKQAGKDYTGKITSFVNNDIGYLIFELYPPEYAGKYSGTAAKIQFKGSQKVDRKGIIKEIMEEYNDSLPIKINEKNTFISCYMQPRSDNMILKFCINGSGDIIAKNGIEAVRQEALEGIKKEIRNNRNHWIPEACISEGYNLICRHVNPDGTLIFEIKITPQEICGITGYAPVDY